MVRTNQHGLPRTLQMHGHVHFQPSPNLVSQIFWTLILMPGEKEGLTACQNPATITTKYYNHNCQATAHLYWQREEWRISDTTTEQVGQSVIPIFTNKKKQKKREREKSHSLFVVWSHSGRFQSVMQYRKPKKGMAPNMRSQGEEQWYHVVPYTQSWHIILNEEQIVLFF